MAPTPQDPHRTRGWVVGRVAGAPVVVSPGWLVAAVVLTLLFAPTVDALSPGLGGGTYVVAGAFVLLLFVSVFLHELAHALVARRRGVVVRELAVTLLGGHTAFGAAAPTPATSALVALAGPAVNLALGLGTWALLQALPGGGLIALVLGAAAIANTFVGVFNLLPGLPLDGGRVLEAVVWRATGVRRTGTAVAGWVGRAVAVGVVVWVLVVPLLLGRQPSLGQVLWGALVGAFLWSGAAGAVRAARAEERLGAVQVARLMRPAVALPERGAVDLVDGLGCYAVLVDGAGRPTGYVDPLAVAAVPPHERGRTPLAAAAVRLPAEAVVEAGLEGQAAVRAVARAGQDSAAVVVLGPTRDVVGLLFTQDVVGALRP